MARVKPIDEKNPELAEFIGKVRGARGGRLINIYRLMLHSPALAEGWFALNQAARYATEIDGRSRELAVLRVAFLNGSDYVLRAHGPSYALQEGLTREQVEAVGDWRPSERFDDRQRALLAYVDAMTRDVAVSDAVFADLRKYFSERQTVEVTMLVGAYNMLTRVLAALQVDPEP